MHTKFLLLGLFPTCVLHVIKQMQSEKMSQRYHGFQKKIKMQQTGFNMTSNKIHGHYLQCFFVHRHLNNAWYKQARSVIGMPYSAIISSNDDIISFEKSDYLWNARGPSRISGLQRIAWWLLPRKTRAKQTWCVSLLICLWNHRHFWILFPWY